MKSTDRGPGGLPAGLVTTLAIALTALAGGNLGSQPPALRTLRARRDVPVYDVLTGNVRRLTAFTDVTGVTPGPRVTGAISLHETDGLLISDAGPLLAEGEFLILPEAVRNRPGGRLLSLAGHDSFDRLRQMDLADPELLAVALSDLVYVSNRDAVKVFLGARGIQVLLTGGELLHGPDRASRTEPTFLVVRHPGLGAALAVRGTFAVADVGRDLDADLVRHPLGGRVHSGFQAGAQDVLRATRALLDDLWRRDPRLILTGHSMGAAIATLMHVALADTHPGLVTLAFATPPVGDRAFVESQARRADGITLYFSTGEVMKQLSVAGSLSASYQLRWIGHRRDVGAAKLGDGLSHFLINYEYPLLEERGEGERWWRGLPVCLLTASPCFDGPGSRVPLCAIDDAGCAARFPELRSAPARGGRSPHEVLAGLRTGLLTVAPARRPIRLFRLAVAAAAAGEPEESRRYLDALGRLGFHAALSPPPVG